MVSEILRLAFPSTKHHYKKPALSDVCNLEYCMLRDRYGKGPCLAMTEVGRDSRAFSECVRL